MIASRCVRSFSFYLTVMRQACSSEKPEKNVDLRDAKKSTQGKIRGTRCIF